MEQNTSEPKKDFLEIRIHSGAYHALTEDKLQQLRDGIMYDDAELTRLYGLSYQNESFIRESGKLGCWSCGRIWKNDGEMSKVWTDITEPDEGEDRTDFTLICPWCSCDSVLCDFVCVLTPSLLQAMSKKWLNIIWPPHNPWLD